MIEWQQSRFDDLSTRQLYAVLAARVAVFIAEQTSPYLDIDGLDQDALHVIAWDGPTVAAYARILGPGIKFAEPSIGRVLTSRQHRGMGLGRMLMTKSLELLDAQYPGRSVRIGAQAYLERFYRSFGFQTVAEPYIEDGIPHLEMLRA